MFPPGQTGEKSAAPRNIPADDTRPPLSQRSDCRPCAVRPRKSRRRRHPLRARPELHPIPYKKIHPPASGRTSPDSPPETWRKPSPPADTMQPPAPQRSACAGYGISRSHTVPPPEPLPKQSSARTKTPDSLPAHKCIPAIYPTTPYPHHARIAPVKRARNQNKPANLSRDLPVICNSETL